MDSQKYDLIKIAKQLKKELDKDRFRRDLGNVEDAYIEIRKRLMGE